MFFFHSAETGRFGISTVFGDREKIHLKITRRKLRCASSVEKKNNALFPRGPNKTVTYLYVFNISRPFDFYIHIGLG